MRSGTLADSCSHPRPGNGAAGMGHVCDKSPQPPNTLISDGLAGLTGEAGAIALSSETISSLEANVAVIDRLRRRTDHR